MALVPVAGPNPQEGCDLWLMFRHYDALYFRGALVDAGFAVHWGSPPATGTARSFGSCSFGGSNTITLYEPILQSRTDADLKSALLHLMIHAILYLKHGRKGIWDHGPIFRDWMSSINSCSAEDRLKPSGGYCITITHDFSSKNSAIIQGFLWRCDSCGNTLVRARNLGPPSDSCCIENAGKDAICGNMLCKWHKHKMNCGGSYVVSKPPKIPDQEKVPEGSCGNEEAPRSSTSRMSGKRHKPEDVEQHVAIEKHGVAKPPGNSTTSKEDELHKPRGIQKASDVPAAPARKLKQEPVATEKNDYFSLVGPRNAEVLDSFSKTQKQRDHDEIQKPIVLPVVPQSILKQPNKTHSIQARKQHKLDGFQETIVNPVVPQTTLKQSKHVAPGRQKIKGKCRKFARKGYAVVSVWQNIYESEGSSGSAEPLVNKRTERRKRERIHVTQRTYSRSMKMRSTSGIISIKTEPLKKGLSQQAKPPSPCLDIIVIDSADQVVTETPGVQSQPRAPCLDKVVIPPVDQAIAQTPGDLSELSARCSVAAADQVIPLQTTDPTGLAHSYPCSSLDVMCISDDD